MVFCPLSVSLKVLHYREFLRTYCKTRKSSFLSLRLVCFEHFKSFQELLFCSKKKVLQIPEILSTLGASYDKVSLLWLLAKFRRNSKSHFFIKMIKMHQICSNMHFSGDFESNHRNEILSYRAGRGLKISGKIHTFCLEQNKKMCGLLKLVKYTIF